MTTLKSTKAANDNASELRQALRRWAENRWDVRGGVKAFLMHLANHAGPDATIYVERKHFERIMSVSPRSITNYVRRLLEEGLIADTGEVYARPSVAYVVYRIAPGEEWIDVHVRRAASVAGARAGGLERAGKSHSRSSEKDAAYKDNYRTDISKSGELSDEAILSSELTDVPAVVVEAIGGSLDEGKLRSFVLPSGWHEATRTIHPVHGYAYDWFRTNARAVLARLGIRLGQPMKRAPAKGAARG